MAKHNGGPFVGTRSCKIVAPGIVKYVMNAGIGGSGTAKSAISVPMGLLSLASIVEQKGKDEYPGFSQYHGGAISIARRKGIDVGKKGKKRKRDTLDRDRSKDQPMCGLCGKTAKLTKTECCDN